MCSGAAGHITCIERLLLTGLWSGTERYCVWRLGISPASSPPRWRCSFGGVAVVTELSVATDGETDAKIYR